MVRRVSADRKVSSSNHVESLRFVSICTGICHISLNGTWPLQLKHKSVFRQLLRVWEQMASSC